MKTKGKTIIITGASGKLGSEIVLHLAQNGHQCLCICNKGYEKFLKSFKKYPNIHIFKCNLQKDSEISRLFAKNLSKYSPDVLINAAGVFDKKPLEKVTAKYIAETMAVNFSAAILMSQQFAKLVGKKKAKIINITDAIIGRSPAGFSIYTASKAALESATKTLAKELAGNITVKAVSPGIIHWPKKIARTSKTKAQPATDTAGEVKKILRKIEQIVGSA